VRRNKRKPNDIFAILESKMTPASIRRSNAKARKLLLSLRLAEFRRALRVDQSKVRGFSQPAVSKIEGRDDVKLSTLVEYCRGLDAELTITARRRKPGTKEFVLLRA
jgi:hypothetical protein